MAAFIKRDNLQYISRGHTPDFDPAYYVILDSKEKIDTALAQFSAVPQKYRKLDSDDIVEMDQAEKDIVDADDLDQAKINKNLSIDLKTRELIYKGFDYNGTLFSLSEAAQTNWNSMRVDIIDEAAPADYFPVYITTKDDDEYTIPDYAEFKAMFKKGMKTKKDYIDDGRALKIQVKQANSIAEVNAIIDSRT